RSLGTGFRELDLETLDHGVREDAIRDFSRELFGGRLILHREVDLEELALADVRHVAVAQRMEGLDDRVALGIEDGRLEGDENTSLHFFMGRGDFVPAAPPLRARLRGPHRPAPLARL